MKDEDVDNTNLGFRESQSQHTNDIRAVRILRKTFGITNSQARDALHQQQARNAARAQPAPAPPKPVLPPVPAIRRHEVITQELRHFGDKSFPDPLLVPPGVVPGGAAGIEEPPGDDTYYLRIRHLGDLLGSWRRGVEEAANDGQTYARRGNAWLDITGNLVLSVTSTSASTIYTNPLVITVTLDDTTGELHFDFVIPQGAPGANGADGSDPTDAHLNDLINAILDDSETWALNPITVATLGMTVSNPPTQGEVQTIADKLDELITALKH